MSDDHSARLALPYLAAGQMQKHVTLNAALTRLDALVQTAVVSRTIRVQPTEAAAGEPYILPDAAEGADWNGRRMRRRLRQDHPRPIELADFEYWWVPGRLNETHWRIQVGLKARPEPCFLDEERSR